MRSPCACGVPPAGAVQPGRTRWNNESFVPSLFDGRWPEVSGAGVGRAAYAEIVGTGGYPAVLDRTDARRARFFESCVDTIVRRDLSTGARAHDRANVRRLLSAIASTSASVLNFDSLARDLGLPAKTLRLHATLLDRLLCHLLGADTARLVGDGSLAGTAFETFAAMELQRQIASLALERGADVGRTRHVAPSGRARSARDDVGPSGGCHSRRSSSTSAAWRTAWCREGAHRRWRRAARQPVTGMPQVLSGVTCSASHEPAGRETRTRQWRSR